MLGESCRLSAKLDSLEMTKNGEGKIDSAFSCRAMCFHGYFLITFSIRSSTAMPHSFSIHIEDQTAVRDAVRDTRALYGGMRYWPMNKNEWMIVKGKAINRMACRAKVDEDLFSVAANV